MLVEERFFCPNGYDINDIINDKNLLDAKRSLPEAEPLGDRTILTKMSC